MGDLPHVAIRVGKGARRASPRRQRCRADDCCARTLGIVERGTDFVGRVDVVSEFNARRAMTAKGRPKRKHHPAGLKKANLIVGLFATAPSERLVEISGGRKVVDPERDCADALFHRRIVAQYSSRVPFPVGTSHS